AGEIDLHPDAPRVRGLWQELPGPGLAARVVRAQDDVPSNEVEELVRRLREARLGQAEGLGELGRERGRGGGQPVAHGGPADGDHGIAGVAGDMRPCRAGPRGEQQEPERQAFERPTHLRVASRRACSHSCPTNRDIRYTWSRPSSFMYWST